MSKNIFCKYYHNIFAASFLYYSNPKLNVSARIGATAVNVLCQMTISFLVVVLLNKFVGFDALIFINKYFFLLLIILLFFMNVIYYKEERIERILNIYEQKSNKEKSFWQVVTVISGIVPIISIAFLLKK